MKKEMLINVLQPEECRIAIVEDGILEELYVERTSHESYVGNIYKGRIVNIEASIQAVFVDFGVGRNGFLHISDVESQYFRQGGYDPDKPIEFPGRSPRRDEPYRGEEAPQAEGEAVLRRRGQAVFADELRYSFQSNEVTAIGRARLDRWPRRSRRRRLHRILPRH